VGTGDSQKSIRAARRCQLNCTLNWCGGHGKADDIRAALRQEYRFTSRSASEGDFVEGIRAAIIDKDRNPRWRHAGISAVTLRWSKMLAELATSRFDTGAGRVPASPLRGGRRSERKRC
jgi:hypothetical protein